MSKTEKYYVVWNPRKRKWLRGARFWRWTSFHYCAAKHDDQHVFYGMFDGSLGYDWRGVMSGCQLFEVTNGHLKHIPWCL